MNLQGFNLYLFDTMEQTDCESTLLRQVHNNLSHAHPIFTLLRKSNITINYIV